MGTLKNKVSRLKSIAGKTETGGAPFYSEDLVTIQENGRADFFNHFESLRRQLPNLLYYQGPGNPYLKEFENGLILSGLEYDNTDPSNPIISEGYILSDGEVCYYPGGTIATGPTFTGLVYLFKGGALPVSRTFDDGFSKEMLVDYACTVETGYVDGIGPVLPGATTIVPTSEVVVLSVGFNSLTHHYAESYFSQRAALRVTDLSVRSKVQAFAPVVLATNWLNQNSFSGSRVNNDLSTTIFGIFYRDFGAVAPPSTQELVFSLATSGSSLNFVTNIGLYIYVTLIDNGLSSFITTALSVDSNGDIFMLEPQGGWPVTGVYNFTVNATIIGSTDAASYSYEIKEDFLNIT
tara:strand:+ start:332 stop:1381 length:1050 start_codon:yes stop_codon:yes gene_type:complete